MYLVQFIMYSVYTIIIVYIYEVLHILYIAIFNIIVFFMNAYTNNTIFQNAAIY